MPGQRLLSKKRGWRKVQVDSTSLSPLGITAAALAADSVTASKIGTGAVTVGKIGAAAVTMAKAAVFFSAEQTGTGASQNVAHGLAAVPAGVLVVPTDTAPATVGAYTCVEGAHDATNVKVTVTTGKKFKVFAWA
jgi:hypothetical protein